MFRALNLKSGGSKFKPTTKLPTGFVLSCPEFNFLATLCIQPTNCHLPVGIFKLNGLVKSTRSKPNHGFVQAIGLRDSLLKVGLMKFPSTANFGLLDIVHKNKHSDKRFS